VSRRRLTGWLLLVGVLCAAVLVTGLQAQRRFFNTERARPQDFDGSFQFCRVMFTGSGRFGSSWSVDWPRADINLSIRLSELTKTRVGRTSGGEPRHVLISLTDPELFNCAFIMMTEVGSVDFSPAEAKNLREYLLKGGFLWADDFWGHQAWEWWAEEFNEVLPAKEYPIIDLDPATHPMFRAQFFVKETPQISSIGYWERSGGDTSERGEDSAIVHTRGVLDKHGNLMALMTHDTDFGDSFEREADDPNYFLKFSIPGYAFGVNALVYAMSH
jgi:hypothetical protein